MNSRGFFYLDHSHNKPIYNHTNYNNLLTYPNYPIYQTYPLYFNIQLLYYPYNGINSVINSDFKSRIKPRINPKINPVNKPYYKHQTKKPQPKINKSNIKKYNLNELIKK